MVEVLSIKNVSKTLGNVKVLDNISFNIQENDIFGYLGPNGAGKTTTIRLILGLLQPDSGNVEVMGQPVTNDKIRKYIGFCFDDDGLYPNLTCLENLHFFAKAYNIDANINKLLKDVNLLDASEKKVSTFSRGMKKRLGVARALLNNPKFLILDEPFIGLDPEGQDDFKTMLKEISKNATIFISSHDLHNLESLCNRICILNKKILFDGELNEFIENNGNINLHDSYINLIKGSEVKK